MAIIIKGKTPCAICNGPLDGPYLATSGCAFPPSHHLWRYCDAPLHIACLQSWPSTGEFSKAYFDMHLSNASRRYRGLISRGEDWFIGVGPARPPSKPYCAQIVSARWPLQVYSKWDDWDVMLRGGYVESLVGDALAEAERLVGIAQAIAPNTKTLELLWRKNVEDGESMESVD